MSDSDLPPPVPAYVVMVLMEQSKSRQFKTQWLFDSFHAREAEALERAAWLLGDERWRRSEVRSLVELGHATSPNGESE